MIAGRRSRLLSVTPCPASPPGDQAVRDSDDGRVGEEAHRYRYWPWPRFELIGLLPESADDCPGGNWPRRICSNCTRAAICWATRAACSPWKTPSSQPTSCAWAIRSSPSEGITSSENGSDSRSSSSRNSGVRPVSSSLIDRSWISRSRARLASSRGAALTSSSSCLIMVPIRITLAGSPMASAGSRLASESPSALAVLSPPLLPLGSASAGTSAYPTGCPSGPITTTRWLDASVITISPLWSSRLLVRCAQHDLADVAALGQPAVRLGGLPHVQHGVDHRPDVTGFDHRPESLPDLGDDFALRAWPRHGPRTQGGRDDARPLTQQGVDIELGGGAALHPDDHQPAAVGERVDVAGQILGAHHVENDVHPPPFGGRLHLLDKVLLDIVDGELSAQVSTGL